MIGHRGDQWVHFAIESYCIQLPLDKNQKDTYPLGMALDFSSVKNLKLRECLRRPTLSSLTGLFSQRRQQLRTSASAVRARALVGRAASSVLHRIAGPPTTIACQVINDQELLPSRQTTTDCIFSPPKAIPTVDVKNGHAPPGYKPRVQPTQAKAAAPQSFSFAVC